MRYVVDVNDNGMHRVRDTVTGGRGEWVPYGSLSTFIPTAGRLIYGATDFFSGVLPTESPFEIVFPVENMDGNPKEPAINRR